MSYSSPSSSVAPLSQATHDALFPACSDDASAGGFSADALLEALRPCTEADDAAPLAEQPAGLTTQLHEYQRQALHWLKSREIGANDQLLCEAGTGGGLLCDEMGLGKTLEVIALVHDHRLVASSKSAPRSAPKRVARAAASAPAKRVAVAAPSPESTANPKSCGATLIVTPAAIASQWESELAKHAAGLRWMRYTGMDRQNPMGVDAFLDADVVLCTYDVLGREVHYLEDHSTSSMSTSLRHVKRFKVEQSPLTKLLFWRVVLDEVQMIGGSGTRQCSKTARAIAAVNRWAVTGTPVSSGVSDLEPLVEFVLGAGGLAEAGWRSLVIAFQSKRPGAAAAMHHFLRGKLWRQTKARVLGEVSLPPQRMHTLTLELSPVERWYYENLVLPAAKSRADTHAISTVMPQLKYACLAPPTCGDPVMRHAVRYSWNSYRIEELNEDGDAPLLTCMRYEAQRLLSNVDSVERHRVFGSCRTMHDCDFRVLFELAGLSYVARGAPSEVAQAACGVAFLFRAAEYKAREWLPAPAECKVLNWPTKRSQLPSYLRPAHPSRLAAIVSELSPEESPATTKRTCYQLLQWGAWGPHTTQIGHNYHGVVYLDEASGIWTTKRPAPVYVRNAFSASGFQTTFQGNFLAPSYLQPPPVRSRVIRISVAEQFERLDPRKRGNELIFSMLPDEHSRMRSARLAMCKRRDALLRVCLPATTLFGPSPFPSPERPRQLVMCSPPHPLASSLAGVHLSTKPEDVHLSTKLTRLVQLLSSVRPEKAVIFASYNEGLEHAKKVLKRVEIGAVRVSKTGKTAAKSIAAFMNDPSIQACLLHSGQDAAGLTLTVAQHVVFLDPVEDVGTMRQAVGRVHRIGQTKETNVWHLVAADTAEEGLHARLRARTAQHAAAAADGPVLIDDGPGLTVRSLLARPLDFYSARRLRAWHFWLNAAIRRLTGSELPRDVSDDLWQLASRRDKE